MMVENCYNNSRIPKSTSRFQRGDVKKVEQPKVQGMMLKTENLSERVVVWLEKAIVHGELRPGDELPSEQ